VNYSTEDAIELQNTITRQLHTHGPDTVFNELKQHDPELLALTLTLHGLKSLPQTTA
jgi:hypothetical protein